MSEPTWSEIPVSEGKGFNANWTVAHEVLGWDSGRRRTVVLSGRYSINGREVTEEEYRAHLQPKRPRFWRDPFRRDS